MAILLYVELTLCRVWNTHFSPFQTNESSIPLSNLAQAKRRGIWHKSGTACSKPRESVTHVVPPLLRFRLPSLVIACGM